jgi:hypothetical protein
VNYEDAITGNRNRIPGYPVAVIFGFPVSQFF